MATILRQYDNLALDTSTLPRSYMLPPDGAYDLKNTAESVTTPMMRAAMAQTMETKVFTLRWLTTDSSGNEQKVLNRFFSKPGLYTITASDWSVSDLEFYVVGITSNFFEENESIEITCQAKNPDFLKRSKKILRTENYAAGANVPSLTASGSNDLGGKASLVITITADSVANWKKDIEVKLTGSSTSGITYRTLNNYKYSRLVMDSYEEVLYGDGMVDPFKAGFFQVNGGASGSWTVASFNCPLVTNVPFTVEIALVATIQAEVLS